MELLLHDFSEAAPLEEEFERIKIIGKKMLAALMEDMVYDVHGG